MKIIKNYLFSLAQQLIAIIIPIITLPYVTRTLGLTNIGIYSYSNSIVTMFMLFIALGVNLYGTREISYNRDDVRKKSEIFWNIMKIKLVAFGLVLAVYSYFIFTSSEVYRMLYIIQIIAMLGVLVDITWYYQGMEEFKSLAIRHFVVKVVVTALLFILVKSSNDLYVYAMIMACSGFLGDLVLWTKVKGQVIWTKANRTDILATIKNIGILFIPQVAISLYTVVDKIVIGQLSGENQVGLYDTTQKLVKVILSLVTALGAVMLAKNANDASKDKSLVKENVYLSSIYMMFISALLVVLLIVNSESFISIFLSAEFQDVGYLLKFSSLIMLFVTMSNVIGIQLMIPLGGYKRFTITVLLGAIANLSLNFILVPRYLALGAIISTVITEFIVFAIQFYLMREHLKKIALLKENLKYLIVVLMLIPFGFYLNSVMYVYNTFITICFISGILSILYVLLLAVLRVDVYKVTLKFIKEGK